MVRRICVLGAGMIGLSSGVRILEELQGVDVTIIADKFSPHTTSDVAAGFWMPYKMGSTSTELIYRWGKETFKYLVDLFHSPLASKVGVHSLSGYMLTLTKRGNTEEFWKDIVYNHRDMTAKELAMFPVAKDGTFFTSMVITGTLYLPWLMSRFIALGGKVKNKKIESLSEVTSSYDVVVNCCGLGNYDLINDREMAPIRGQIMRANAPWLKHFVVVDDADRPVYIFPTAHNVVLGGTLQKGNWNMSKDAADRKRILDDCVQVVPSLKDAEVVVEMVGLRPFRECTRLDKETIIADGHSVLIINNYGHGGCGLTTFWGCAHDVVDMIADSLSMPLVNAKL